MNITHKKVVFNAVVGRSETIISRDTNAINEKDKLYSYKDIHTQIDTNMESSKQLLITVGNITNKVNDDPDDIHSSLGNDQLLS